jgi:hypothetical protein
VCGLDSAPVVGCCDTHCTYRSNKRPALVLHVSRGSSVGIVSGYGLDDQAIKVLSRQIQKDFSFILCVQTGSGAHAASSTMGSVGPFPGTKARPERDADHSPPPSVEVENE